MNIDKIEFSAKVLEEKLKEYAVKDNEASRLYDDLRPLLELAKSKRILTPIEVGAVPGRYRFTENGLQGYSDLEEAYAVFSIEIIGGEPPFLKMLRAEKDQKQLIEQSGNEMCAVAPATELGGVISRTGKPFDL